MDDRRIEAALRSGPPAEPEYRGDVGARLVERIAAPEDAERQGVAVITLSGRRRHRRRPLLTGAAAAVIAIVGLVAISRSQVPSVVSVPAPSAPSTTISASITSTTAPADGVPPQLVDRWVGAPRSAAGLGAPTSAAFVEIGSDYLSYKTGIADNPSGLDSRVTAEGADVLRVELTGQGGGCSQGAVGHYRWAISPEGTTLRLTALDDECAGREAALGGRWVHTACPIHGSDCLGPVEPGTYASVTFNPFDTNTYGQLFYQLPEGWSVTADAQTRLVLQPDVPESDKYGIYVWADVAVPQDACSTAADPSAGSTADDVATWLDANPALDVARISSAISGRPAEIVDVQLAESWTQSCPENQGVPSLNLLTSRPDATTSWRWSIAAGQPMRLLLLDLEGDHTTAIIITDDLSSRYDDLLAAATAIVESFEFSPTIATR